MVSMIITDRDGEARRLQVDPGLSVMEVMRDNGFGVDGTCGGMAYCASCHVYVRQQDLSKLALPDETEVMTVEGLVHAQQNSRLGCQIEVSEKLDGIELTLAAAEI